MKENKIFTIVLVAALLIVVNGLFFVFVKTVSWSQTTVCILFCNVAVLAMFLPLITSRNGKEIAQRSSMYLLSSSYLITEIISVFIILNMEGMSATNAFIWQGIMLALFLLIYFSVFSADAKSNRDIQKNKATSSIVVKKALYKLRFKLDGTEDNARRALLQEAIAMLTSTSTSMFAGSDDIDCEIFDNCSELCANICKENLAKLKQSIYKRRAEMLAFQ